MFAREVVGLLMVNNQERARELLLRRLTDIGLLWSSNSRLTFIDCGLSPHRSFGITEIFPATDGENITVTF